MAKINVLRRVNCFYNGNIQLPIGHFYPLSDDSLRDIEWAVTKNFKTLSIFDYENELNKSDEKGFVKIDKQYKPEKKVLVIKARNSKGESVAYAELTDIVAEKSTNIKRFFSEAPCSEITILHYFHNIDLPVNPKQSAVEFNDEVYKRCLDSIISLYIKASGDWVIARPDQSPTPIYFESHDIYFDNDIPMIEMRIAFLKKKDNAFDIFHGSLDAQPVLNRNNFITQHDPSIVENNIVHILRMGDSDKVKMIDSLTKARREVLVNNNNKYAFLDAFTLAEIIVAQYLTECKIKAGISKGKIADYEEEVGIGYKLNIELPLFLKPDEKERKVIGELDKVRKKRNKIIHSKGNDEPVTREEAMLAIDCIQSLFAIIEQKSNH